MLKLVAVAVTTALISLSVIPKPASAQTCSQIERYALQVVQANMPPVGSANYLTFISQQALPYFARLQQEYPRCNIYRTGSSNDLSEDFRRLSNDIYDSALESDRQYGETTFGLNCSANGGTYDREFEICIDP